VISSCATDKCNAVGTRGITLKDGKNDMPRRQHVIPQMEVYWTQIQTPNNLKEAALKNHLLDHDKELR